MRNLLSILALAATIPACTFDAGGADADSVTPLRATLGHRAFLDLAGDSRVGVTATGPDGASMPDVTPTVTGGRAVLRSTEDGFVVVEYMNVKLADVEVPAGTFGARPITLTDLSLRLGTQVDIDGDWAPSGLSVTGAGTGDVLLDWSMLLEDGSHYQLATQKLAHAPFDVAVSVDDYGRLTATAWMSADGKLRTFADRVTLSDLSLAVVAERPGVSSR
jgi:hypothetical protein